MKYKIIATAEIPCDDEDSLKTELQAMNTYVENKGGTVKHIVRDITDE